MTIVKNNYIPQLIQVIEQYGLISK